MQLREKIYATIQKWSQDGETLGIEPPSDARQYGLAQRVKDAVVAVYAGVRDDDMVQLQERLLAAELRVAYYERTVTGTEHDVRAENQKLYEVIAYLLNEDAENSAAPGEAAIPIAALSALEVGLTVTEDTEAGFITLKLTKTPEG